MAYNALNDLMDMDHVIQVHEGGRFTDAPDGVWAPEVHDDNVDQGDGWSLMNGYSSQYSYSGPAMHASEYIGGKLAEAILETPGYYVATVVSDGSETPESWCVAFKEVEA